MITVKSLIQHQNSKSPLTIAALTAFFAALMAHCGSNSSSEKPINQTQRSGNSIYSVAPDFIDDSPSINKNGTTVLFHSGRDKGTSRIFKSTLSGTSWSAPEKLSANSGMTAENIAKISPDGVHALVQGTNDSGEVLSLCAVATGICSVIASNPWKSGEFAFSADSTMFFYLKGTKSTGSSLYVAMTSDGANAFQVGETDKWIKAFWSADAGATYALVSAQKSTTAGKMTLIKRAFGTPAANASTATASTLGSDLPLGTTLDPYSGSTARFSVILPLRASTTKVFTELGSYKGADKKSIPISTEIHSWQVNGSDEGAVTALTGSETSFAWISNDNSTIFTLNRVALRCADDTDSTWGNALALINRSDNVVTWLHVKKPIDLKDSPTVTSDPCDRTVNGAATSLDLSISEMTVNRDATATTHTIVWTSGMTGDPEIFASVTVGGTTTVYNISRNLSSNSTM